MSKTSKYAWMAQNKFTLLSVFLACMMFVVVQLYHPKGVSPQSTVVGGAIATGTALIGGDFTVVDDEGNPFTQEDLKGRFSLIFFGFTFCPDVCPTTLLKVNEALAQLPEDMRGRVQPIFVSIDPKRDTPEKLHEFLEGIAPEVKGLTGTPEQIKQMADAYRVYYAKRETGDPDYYMMDHSAFMYFMDPNGQYMTHFGHDDTAEEIAARIKELAYR